MYKALISIFLFLSLRAAASSDAIDVRTLPPHSPHGVMPELRVREHHAAGVRTIALQCTLAGDTGEFMIYNPFGFEANGRCYQVELVDAQGHSVATIIPRTAIPGHVTSDLWSHVSRRGIVGRCFWACSEKRHDMASLPAVPEGDYSLCLIASKRLFHLPAPPEDSSARFDTWKVEWKSADLDKPYCVSQLVPVHVDHAGVYHLTAKDTGNHYRPFEIQPSVNDAGVILSRFWLVCDRATDLSVFRCNLAADSLGPDHWNVVRTDGTEFEILARPVTGKGYFRKVTDRTRVPQWGIMGGIRSGIAVPDPPGEYEVTAEIDESLYWDRVYDPETNTRRQPPQKEWPTVFRSEPRVVDVRVIPKSH